MNWIARLKRKWSVYYVKRFVLKVRKDEWCFIPLYGIGDTYLLLSLLTAFRQQNPDVQKVKLVLTSPNHIDLIKLFPDTITWVILLDIAGLEYIPLKNSLTKGEAIVFSCIYFFPNAMTSLLGYKNFTINEIYKLMLNLSVESPNSKPVITKEIAESGTRRFNEYGLKKDRTVLLAPHSRTINAQSLPVSFWEEIIHFLLENDYQVAVLTNDVRFQLHEQVKFVYFTLDEAIPFVELCGYMISVRSGICDLLATAGCEKFILYPRHQHNSRNITQWSSLMNMGLANKKIHELIFDENTLAETMDVIKNKINSNNKVLDIK